MTENEWVTSERPWPLWGHLIDRDLLSDRKRRLFCALACRRIAHFLTDPRSLRMIEACEAYAEEQLDLETFLAWDREAFVAARELEQAGAPGEQCLAAHGAKWLGVDNFKVGRAAEYSSEVFGYLRLLETGIISREQTIHEAVAFWRHPEFLAGQAVEERHLTGILRELFGNPFRPVAFSPEWQTSTVLALARQMYDTRDFAPMPILADALQDAGCDHDDILTHCRDPHGTHVRGCWVVDLVLGKA